MTTVILGAGVTGLSAGQYGGDIYEASDVCGGICRSYNIDGYTFENGGGHWIFGVDAEAEEFFSNMGVRLNRYTRDTAVHMNKIIRGNIQDLTSSDCATKEGTMKKFLLDRFGRGLCELFFFPFNNKYTAGLYSEVANENDFKSPKNSDSIYNDVFCYPEKNTQFMVEKMAKNCDITYGKKAVYINPIEKIVEFSDGSSVSYKRLISTIPLNDLVRITPLLEHKYKTALPYTSTFVLNIGADAGRNLPSAHWIYIPHSNSGFYRVGIYSDVRKDFARIGTVSLYVERSIALNSPLRKDDKECLTKIYTDSILEELHNMGYIEEVHVADASIIEVSYTYRYPEGDVTPILNKFRQHDIISTGRYGKWKFQGIVESIKDGLRAGRGDI